MLKVTRTLQVSNVRFQVLTATSMKLRIVFWDALQCKIIVDRRFRGTYCFHHQGWVRHYVPLKRRSTIILHGSISQKTTLNIILAAVRTWNLTSALLVTLMLFFQIILGISGFPGFWPQTKFCVNSVSPVLSICSSHHSLLDFWTSDKG
jgi:hypothetical protein